MVRRDQATRWPRCPGLAVSGLTARRPRVCSCQAHPWAGRNERQGGSRKDDLTSRPDLTIPHVPALVPLPGRFARDRRVRGPTPYGGGRCWRRKARGIS